MLSNLDELWQLQDDDDAKHEHEAAGKKPGHYVADNNSVHLVSILSLMYFFMSSVARCRSKSGIGYDVYREK